MTQREFLYMQAASQHALCLKQARECGQWMWFDALQAMVFSGMAIFGDPSVLIGVMVVASAVGFFAFRHLRKKWESLAQRHSEAMERLGKPEIFG